MENELNLIYWTKNENYKNLGDYIGEVFLKLSNYKITDEGTPAYFCVGTLFSKYWWNEVKQKKIIWGSGSCGFDFPKISPMEEILAVRGPMTRQWLNLPDDIPLGDPALLLPRIYSPKNNNLGPILVSNFHNEYLDPPLTQINLIKKISMKVTKDNWNKVIDKIYSSEFILANSLHSSIIAFAYEKPWAFYSPKNSIIPLPLRWNDWFCYLDIPKEGQHAVNSLEEGINWWEKYRLIMKRPSIQKLIDNCPWSSLRKLIS